MSHSLKRKSNTNSCFINEDEDKSQSIKKSCKDKRKISDIFEIMMSNGRYLSKNMDKFKVESVQLTCYFCGCTENLNECHKCKNNVCYLRSGCSMMNTNNNNLLYCLDCL